MIQVVLKRFHELFTHRCNNISFLDISEDSVRYDFSIAISEILKLNPWDIQLQSGIVKSICHDMANEPGSKKDRPELDMVIMKNDININVEFDLFRKESFDEVRMNKNARTIKMLNDMVRLAFDSYFTKRKCYYVCVTDKTLIGHKINSDNIKKFPSDYGLSKSMILKLKETYTKGFDERIISRIDQNISAIQSTIIYNQLLKANGTSKTSRIIAWEVKCL